MINPIVSEYLFGLTRGRQDDATVAAREKIARKHGCIYTYANIPGSGWQGWYAGPNYGDPFNRHLAERVAAAESEAL